MTDTTASFSYTKDAADNAWYEIDFTETIASIVSTSVAPVLTGAPAMAGDVAVSMAQITTNGLGVAFLATGGVPGRAYLVRVGVVTAGGSTLYAQAVLAVSAKISAVPSVRTVTLPINPNADWGALAWGSKDPADSLPYQVDATAWLADAGLAITSVAASASADLIVSGPTFSGGVISTVIGGGSSSAKDFVSFAISLSNGAVLEAVIGLPIRVGVAGLVAVAAAQPPRWTDDFGNLAADDFGNHFLAAA